MLLTPILYSDLFQIAERFEEDHPNVSVSSEAMQFKMATTVLRTLLGNNWGDSNLLSTNKPDRYLRTPGSSPQDRMRAQARIVALGEMCYNLQEINGFETRVKDLVRASLETGMAEMEAARLLRLSDIKFRFVQEQGKRGLDYDIEISFAETTICAESKCKVEGTSLSRSSLLNSLNKARKQLPPGKPGIVFVKLPIPWIRDDDMAPVGTDSLNEFFRTTSRVVEVIFHWEEWHHIGGSVARLAKYHEEPNGQSSLYDESITKILRPWSPIITSSRWAQFREIVNKARSR